MATKVNEIIQAAIIRIIMIVLIFILEFPRIGVLRQLVGSRYFAFFLPLQHIRSLYYVKFQDFMKRKMKSNLYIERDGENEFYFL